MEKATKTKSSPKGSPKKQTSQTKSLLLPKVDFIFKRIFGNEQNKDLLISFLSSVLKIKASDIKIVKIIDPALSKEHGKDKSGTLDVRAEVIDKDGHIADFDIEIQLKPHRYMAERILFYLSKMFVADFEQGMGYDKLKKSISIVIFDEDFLPLKKYHSIFHFWEDVERYLLSDILEVHILELKKGLSGIDKTSVTDNELLNWMLFMSNDDEGVCKMLAQASPALERAVNIQERLSMDKTTRHLYDRRLVLLADEITRADELKEAEAAEMAAKEELNAAKKEANTAKKEANTAKKEANTAKKEANTAKKEANTAKKELNSAKKEANVAKKETSAARKIANAAMTKLKSAVKTMQGNGLSLEQIRKFLNLNENELEGLLA